ncbi:MAG: hypothetical protein LQ338_001984 [Usnochroma carphineum]|nr:MAG: hypothetical protein LQ338_001984 [Usnochroma carphineum]
MPILESKSEAFLHFISSLQKGKGKENSSPDTSQPSVQQVFTADDWKTPTTIVKDVEAAAAPVVETPNNGTVEPAVAGPTDNQPESEGINPTNSSKDIGVADPALAEHAAANGFSSTVDVAVVGATDDNAPYIEENTTMNDTAQATGATADEPNHYATTSKDPSISELQITTRSMTTSGAATTQPEISAATEKPASSSRLPSPAPAASTPTTSAWPSSGLLSSGSDFLKALPQAAEAFKSRMKKVEAITPTTATLDDDDDGNAAAAAAGASEWPKEEEQAAGRQSGYRESHPLPHPEGGRSFGWMQHSTASAGFGEASYGPVAATHTPSPRQQDQSTMIRYSEALLKKIGMQTKEALFGKLVEMEGKGRVDVGIVVRRPSL